MNAYQQKQLRKSIYIPLTLCLSESFGLKAYIEGKFYPVSLCDTIGSVRGGTAYG